jgi:hypothetical protein
VDTYRLSIDHAAVQYVTHPKANRSTCREDSGDTYKDLQPKFCRPVTGGCFFEPQRTCHILSYCNMFA